MSNPEHKSWLSGLFESRRKQAIKLTFKDSVVSAQMLGLAEKNNLTLRALMRGFLRVGVLADKSILVSRDQMGFEKPVGLMDEDFAPEKGAGNSRIRHEITLPIRLTNNLKKIANRHGISVEELLIRICKLGIRIAQTKDNPDIDYVFRVPGKDDAGFKNIDLFG